MILEVRAVAPFYKNGFLAGCERTREAILIDPGDEVDELLAAVRDLDVDDTGYDGSHLRQNPPGRSARRAERRGELHQRRPLAEVVLDVGAVEDAHRPFLSHIARAGAADLMRSPEAPVAHSAPQPEGGRGREYDDQDPRSITHKRD